MLSYERESKSRGRGRALKTKRPNGRNKRGGRGRKRGGREADRFPGGREGPAGGRAPPRPASSPRPVPGRARNCQVREKVPRSLLFLILFLFSFVKAPLVTALSQAVQRGQMQRGRAGACVCGLVVLPSPLLVQGTLFIGFVFFFFCNNFKLQKSRKNNTKVSCISFTKKIVTNFPHLFSLSTHLTFILYPSI